MDFKLLVQQFSFIRFFCNIKYHSCKQTTAGEVCLLSLIIFIEHDSYSCLNGRSNVGGHPSDEWRCRMLLMMGKHTPGLNFVKSKSTRLWCCECSPHIYVSQIILLHNKWTVWNIWLDLEGCASELFLYKGYVTQL